MLVYISVMNVIATLLQLCWKYEGF